jgi:hypothetical protein
MHLVSPAVGVLAAVSLLAACSETPGLPAGTYAHFQNFKQAPLHRAYALARNVNGSYSAVFVGNQSSPAAAEQAALAQCRSYASQFLYADPSSCRLYAVDDTILSTGQKIAPAATDG